MGFIKLLKKLSKTRKRTCYFKLRRHSSHDSLPSNSHTPDLFILCPTNIPSDLAKEIKKQLGDEGQCTPEKGTGTPQSPQTATTGGPTSATDSVPGRKHGNMPPLD